MAYSLTQVVAFLALPIAISGAPLQPRQSSKQTYTSNALTAASVLNSNWFNTGNGLYSQSGTNYWWQSANILTTIGNLAEVDSAYVGTAANIFKESFSAAEKYNGGSFLNSYYDDEGWWALAWIKAYDVTRNQTYLSAAQNIFSDLTGGLGATCNGQWWDKSHGSNNAIENELFTAVAASLVNRVTNRKSYYLNYATNEINWLLAAGLQTSNHTFHDGLTLSNCQAEGAIWTYNQGVVLGALVELAKATGNQTYLSTATTIAQGAISSLVDSNGILTELPEYPNVDSTSAQFKGVFVRNLGYLQAAAANSNFVTFLQNNANAIWSQDRSSNNQLGPNWQGTASSNTGYSPVSQGAALDCLIAAAAVS